VPEGIPSETLLILSPRKQPSHLLIQPIVIHTTLKLAHSIYRRPQICHATWIFLSQQYQIFLAGYNSAKIAVISQSTNVIYISCSFPSFFVTSFPNPSNAYTPTSLLPHAMEMAIATRRVSPTLYPTPPPSAPLSAVAGPSVTQKQNANHHLPTQQSNLPSRQESGGDDGIRKESRVSLLTAQLIAQAQVCSCPWRCNGGCDAVLGSIDLLQRVCLCLTTLLRADKIACQETFAHAYTHVYWLSMPLGAMYTSGRIHYHRRASGSCHCNPYPEARH
jgi:hypothetical protein